MALVEGIGGVFIESEDAAALADWYREHLDIAFAKHPGGDSFFVVFRTRDLSTGEVRESPVLAISQALVVLARPEQRGVVVNLRVQDLGKALGRLEAMGVAIEDRRVEWEGGKHAWIRDLDGNRIELYEEISLPPDSEYRSG